MARNVLVDVGFLVALLGRRDSRHLITDSDFRIYRRHSRQVVPCVMPSH